MTDSKPILLNVTLSLANFIRGVSWYDHFLVKRDLKKNTFLEIRGKCYGESGVELRASRKVENAGSFTKEACVSTFGHAHTLQGSYSDVRIVPLGSVWGGGCGTQYCLWATLSDTLSNLE